LSTRQWDPQLADGLVGFPRCIFDSRFWQLLRAGLSFTGLVLTDKFAFVRQKTNQRQLKAQRIRKLLLDLGPSFIKLGQFLSARTDLLPPELISELSKLQDQVPPFDYELVKTIVATELGGHPEEIFAYFEPQPIASASIGQVHRARLLDGAEVVVKVQRPDLSDIFIRDLGYLRLWARCRQSSNQSWLNICDEMARIVWAEMDYLQEGRNADHLRQVLRLDARIKIPKVHWRYSRRRVLVLEYLPGIKIDQIDRLKEQGINLKNLSRLLVECYMQQVLSADCFHADTHAGNLAVDKSGHLLIYDFGVLAQISAAQRRALQAGLTAVQDGDAHKLADCLTTLQLVAETSPRQPLIRLLEPLLAYLQGQTTTQLDLDDLQESFDQLTQKQTFKLPAELTGLLRTLTCLDGILRNLDPNFSLVKTAAPLLRKWWWQKTIDRWLSPAVADIQVKPDPAAYLPTSYH